MGTFNYNSTIPAASHSPASDQPIMQSNAQAISDIINVDHYTFEQSNLDGWHRKSTYIAAGDASSSSGQIVQYAKTSSGSSEIFVVRDGGSPIQMTRGNVSAATSGHSFLPGGILIQWGSVTTTGAAGTFTFPIPFTSAVYSVSLTTQLIGTATASLQAAPGLSSISIRVDDTNIPVYVIAIGV